MSDGEGLLFALALDGRGGAEEVDAVEAALKAHQGLAPVAAQQLDLFVGAGAARGEVLPEGVVLDVVPAHPDAKAETLSRKQVEVGDLLCHQRGLTLRENDDARRKLDPFGLSRQVGKEHEGVVKGIPVERECNFCGHGPLGW